NSPPKPPVHGGLGGEGTPGENTLPSGFQDPSGVLTALAVAISVKEFTVKKFIDQTYIFPATYYPFVIRNS
ncbi:MAG: hypothetical protein ACOYOY_13695, partial [Planktothrix agardhii]